MKASDIAKAQKLVTEAQRDQSIIDTLSSGEAMTLSIGKVEIQLTSGIQDELRGRIVKDLQAQIATAAKALEEMGVEL